MLTFEEIQQLIETVADRELERVEIERAGFRLQIVGQSAPTVVQAALPPAQAPQAPVAVAAPEVAPAPAAAAAGESEGTVASDAHILESPIVGTFYSSPNPEADPYVRPGDRVRQGQVLCIVEAMKLMNEIEADVDGVIVEVFPKNSQPVEFGEPLFAIDAD